MHFELNESQVVVIEQMLRETGEVVNREAVRAQENVHAAQGALSGHAFMAARNKQTELGEAASRLHQEIAFISEALGLARNLVNEEEEMGMQEFMNVSYDNPTYSRI